MSKSHQSHQNEQCDILQCLLKQQSVNGLLEHEQFCGGPYAA